MTYIVLQIEAGSVNAGDTLMITGREFGLTKQKMDKLTVNGITAEKVKQGYLVTFPLEEKITAKEKFYKIVSVENG